MPGFIAVGWISGLWEHWETHIYWSGNQALYPICTKKVWSDGSATRLVSCGRDDQPAWPEHSVEAALEMGERILKIIPAMKNRHGAIIESIWLRTDTGCHTGAVPDVTYGHWKEGQDRYFCREIEWGGANRLSCYLKEDFIPTWGKCFYQHALDIMFKRL